MKILEGMLYSEKHKELYSVDQGEINGALGQTVYKNLQVRTENG